MKLFLSALLLLTAALLSIPAWSSDDEPPVVVYPASAEFDEVVENIQLAITDRGMLVSGTLHVQDMLARTGVDLGFPEDIYLKAQAVEFCSALMSHRMIAADPRNLVICPFTIAAYVLTEEPEQAYVAYRRQVLAGESAEVSAAVRTMLDEIARDAAE